MKQILLKLIKKVLVNIMKKSLKKMGYEKGRSILLRLKSIEFPDRYIYIPTVRCQM